MHSGATLYYAQSVFHTVSAWNTTGGTSSTIAGSASGFSDGVGAAAKFSTPLAVALDPTGARLYIADSVNNRVRLLTLSAAAVSTYAGG